MNGKIERMKILIFDMKTIEVVKITKTKVVIYRISNKKIISFKRGGDLEIWKKMRVR